MSRVKTITRVRGSFRAAEQHARTRAATTDRTRRPRVVCRPNRGAGTTGRVPALSQAHRVPADWNTAVELRDARPARRSRLEPGPVEAHARRGPTRTVTLRCLQRRHGCADRDDQPGCRPGRSDDWLADQLHSHVQRARHRLHVRGRLRREAQPAPRPRSVTGGPTTYNVAVSGMATRGTVIATIPAGGAMDAAGNTNTASGSTDNSVTWDRVPATTTPTFSPSPPKTNDLLIASTTTSDPDGDNISSAGPGTSLAAATSARSRRTRSHRQPAGVRTVSLDLSANYVPTSCTGTMINPLNPSKGDPVIAQVTPNDGLFNGSTADRRRHDRQHGADDRRQQPGGNGERGRDEDVHLHDVGRRRRHTVLLRHLSEVRLRRNAQGSPTVAGGTFDCLFPDGPATPTVAVKVTDGTAASNEPSFAVSVSNVAPSIAISGAARVNEGSAYSLTGRGQRPGHRHGHELRRALGRRQRLTPITNGAKTHTYADGPANASRVTVDLVDEDGNFLDRANALSVRSTTSPRRSPSRGRRLGRRGQPRPTASRSPTRATTPSSSVAPSCGADGTQVERRLNTTTARAASTAPSPTGRRARPSASRSATPTAPPATRDTQHGHDRQRRPDGHLDAAHASANEGQTHTYTLHDHRSRRRHLRLDATELRRQRQPRATTQRRHQRQLRLHLPGRPGQLDRQRHGQPTPTARQRHRHVSGHGHQRRPDGHA